MQRRRHFLWWLQWATPLALALMALGQVKAKQTGLAVLLGVLAVGLIVKLATSRPTTERTDSQESSD